MRVAIVDPSSFSRPYDHELCRALGRAGNDVTLVTCAFDYTAAPAPESYSTTELFYSWQPGEPNSRQRTLAKAIQHPIAMLRARHFAQRQDVLHFQWLALEEIDQFLVPKRSPFVYTAHNALPRSPRPSQLKALRNVYAKAAAIIVHTAGGRQRLVELGVPAAKIAVIPQGAYNYLRTDVSPASLPAELAGSGARVVLMFGLLRPYKGLDTLLAAWRDVGAPDTELWIVGSPRMDMRPLRAAAPSSVRFLPRYIADAEIPPLFERADIVVLPYREIDQSGVVFAALALGRPLLLTDIDGFRDLGAMGGAELVAPDDAAALGAKLRNLLSDEPRRRELSARAFELAATSFSWEGIARQTMDVYESLLPAA